MQENKNGVGSVVAAIIIIIVICALVVSCSGGSSSSSSSSSSDYSAKSAVCNSGTNTYFKCHYSQWEGRCVCKAR